MALSVRYPAPLIVATRSTRTRKAGARPSTGLRPEVEGLRAVAVLLVIANHVFSAPAGGFVGVDVFFVISGFLITDLLVREHERSGRISIPNFYRRRARRILPAAMLVLAACTACAPVLFFATRAHKALIDILWSAGFLANIHFAAVDTNYFNAGSAPSPVQHFWSLAVEEQFYVVWPLVLMVVLFAGRRLFPPAPRLLALVVTVLAVGGLFALAVQQTHQNRASAYFATSARAWELGTGALIALTLPYLNRLPRWFCRLALAAGLITIGISAGLINSSSQFPAPVAAGPVLGAALVIIGGVSGADTLVAWPLTNPASRYVGRISYSLYLWHWPVLIFMATRLDKGSYFNIVTLLTIGAVSVLSYHFVEAPLRRLDWGKFLHGQRAHRTPQQWPEIRQRRRAALAAATLAICAVLVWTVRPAAEVPSFAASPSAVVGPTSAPTLEVGEVSPPATLTTSINQALQATSFPDLKPGLGDLDNAKAAQWQACQDVEANNLANCTFAATTTPAKKLVLIGDSFAISWIPTLLDLRSQGYTIYALTRTLCPAAQVTVDSQLGVPAGFGASCNAHRDWAVSEVAKLKPDIVVLASREGQTIDSLADKSKAASEVTAWGTGTTQMIKRVKAAGGQRVVLLAPPPDGPSLATCAQSTSSNPGACVSTIAPKWQQITGVERTAAQQTGITYVDSQLLFCSANGYCPSFIATTPVRADGEHLTDTYATSLGPILMPLIIG